MKQLRSTPKDKGFFEIYAPLIVTLKRSGYAAQVVSALTEVGGIYAAAYVSLSPIVPTLAFYLAAIIALIGTAVIELGLRKLLPHTVDSILYKRKNGLHLPISFFIWLSALILIAASGYLSFSNSKIIVEQVTPDAEQLSTSPADSLYQEQALAISQQYKADSTAIANQFNTQISAINAQYDGQVKAKERKYSNLKNKERRTGNSYATAKDRIKAQIADIKAEKAANAAELETDRSRQLTGLLAEQKAQIKTANLERQESITEIKGTNQLALDKRNSQVKNYGGGLAWFTIICLIVLITSIILDRIHKKGSGIVDKVALSQYDISPPAWIEALDAIYERWQYEIRNRINRFAESTPPAPLPVAKAPVYDPSEITEQVDQLKYQEEPEEENVIYLEKRKRIGGFSSEKSREMLGTRKRENTHTKSPNEAKQIVEFKGRLKQYQRRLGRHKKKAKQQEEKKGKINQRTADAIANNQHWVDHYSQLIRQTGGTP